MSHRRCTLPMECERCPSSSCLIPEFTAECTNQCLVLACDDPDHDQQACLVTNGATPCDGTCITAAACNDCTGIDDIVRTFPYDLDLSYTSQLQCCTDYHSYLSHDPFVPWDPSLPCDCTPDLQSVYPAPLSHSIQALISDSSISSSTSSSPSLSPFSPLLHPPSPFPTYPAPPHSFSCMWAGCNSAFNTLSALVGHVNLQHLSPIDPPPNLLSHPEGSTSVLPQPPLSCHWGDCAMFPSSSSIPNSSSASSDDHILNVLATHLLQDHLGVNYPLPSVPLQPPPPTHVDTPDTPHPPIPPIPPSHDCSGAHPCKWSSCTESFSSCDDLTAHIASVHIGAGKAHYECFWQDCSRNGTNGFSSKQKISRHLQSHTGHRPFQCDVCNQCFSEAATLQQHMRRHTREKPYVCDFPGCGKAFAITGALTIHKRTHNGLRPFKCKFCDRAFSESSNLTKHLRTHTGARPYMCTEQGCGKAFARPDQLARHMNVHRKKSLKG